MAEENQNTQSPDVGHKISQNSNDIPREQLSSSSQPDRIPNQNSQNQGQENTQRTSSRSVKDIILTTIFNQVNYEENAPTKWIKSVVDKIYCRFKRMPNGWWPKVQLEFNSRYNEAHTLIQIKNAYSSAKNKATRLAAIEVESSDQENRLPIEIENAALFLRVRNRLISNIEKVNNEITEQLLRKRTRKIYSHDKNQDILNYLNVTIRREKIDEKINSIEDLNNVVYACQLTYDEETERPKKINNWKESIEVKIHKLDQELDIINSSNGSQASEMIKLCKRNRIHSNNVNQVQKLKDQIEENRDAYRKRIDISEKRIAYRRSNKMFEFNRRMFYRNLNEIEEIEPNIDKQDVEQFWRGVWRHKSDTLNYEDLIRTLQPADLTTDLSRDRISELILNQIRFLPNWRSPGPDHVYNFYIKTLDSLHNKLVNIMLEILDDPEKISPCMYMAYTYLIPKKHRADNAKDLRPITCLPNMYKLLSKVVTTIVGEICDINEIISDNQLGAKKRCQGAKEQALTNKCLNEKYGNNLFTSWIDITKAFDSVNHEYIIDVIRKLELPQNIIKFVERTLKMQHTTLICSKTEMGKIKIEKGLLQGDALSPLLFVLALEPLSRVLNLCDEKVRLEELRRNHLIFIDDIKLICKTEEQLMELCQKTKDCLDKMGFHINQDKSASNVDNSAMFGKEVDDLKGYKYLGVLEDSRNVMKPENKDLILNRIEERTMKLCQTKLNAINLFKGINEFAISSINYYVGLLPYEPDEFKAIDMSVRRILKDNKVIRNASNMDRLYLPRNNLGRGLTNVQDMSEVMLLNFGAYLNSKSSTRDLITHEIRTGTHLGLIDGYIGNKYQVNQEQLNSKIVKEKQLGSRMERIQSKNMHSLLFQDEDGYIDRKQSSMWLMKGNITPQQEGLYCKMQDRNVYLGGVSKCPHCHRGPNSVDHLSTHCGRLLKTDYSKRHDEIVKCLHFTYCKRYGLNNQRRLKNYKVPEVISNKRVKIKSDTTIITENEGLRENKPDLLIHDYQKKEITIIEVGITSKTILPTTETTKARKYEMLGNELVCTYPGSKVVKYPVVMTWDGLVTKHFKRYLMEMGISDRVMAYFQTVVLKRTSESILVDCKRDHRLYDEEDVSAALDRLEAGSSNE